MLGKFTGEDKADGCLDFAGRDGRLLVVGRKLGGLGSCCKGPVSSGVNYRPRQNHNTPMRSKMSLTKEFRMSMALLEIPVLRDGAAFRTRREGQQIKAQLTQGEPA